MPIYGKSYAVEIVATDRNGEKIRIKEVAEFPNLIQLTEREYHEYGYMYPRSCLTVDEEVREAKAIAQVARRMPWLRDVHALSSIAIDSRLTRWW